MVRRKFKENLHALRDKYAEESSFPCHYKLPDDKWLELDFNERDMHPIDLYTEKDAYEAYFKDIIKPVYLGLW